MQSKGLSRVFSNTTVQKHPFFSAQLSSQSNSHIHGKTIALTRWNFVGKVMYLLFNMLFRLVITFLPRTKCLLISWLQSPSAVILEPKKIKSDGTYTQWSITQPLKRMHLNTFESVLMRWMKLEPIIQSEVSQKEKHQYSILTHIYGI